MIKVKIINKSPNNLPKYATEESAGMDIHAHLTEPVTLQPLERSLIPTGIHIELPSGYEAQLRMRSGWALKKGLMMPNAPATIDADYRGEIHVILANISNQAQTIQPGDRMAQMIIAKYEKVEWSLVNQLSDTARGEGGFGSTGG